jgi:hypothetical protein
VLPVSTRLLMLKSDGLRARAEAEAMAEEILADDAGEDVVALAESILEEED